MAFRDFGAPLIQMILFVIYGIYVFFGLVLLASGIYYISQVDGANSFAATVCVACGFFMLLVGGLAIFGNVKKNGLVMVVVLLIDVGLFVILLAAMMVAVAVTNEIKDPVSKAVHETYCDEPYDAYCARTAAYNPDNPGVRVRQNAWSGMKALFGEGAPVTCSAFDKSLIEQSTAKVPAADVCDAWGWADRTDRVDGITQECIVGEACSSQEDDHETVCDLTAGTGASGAAADWVDGTCALSDTDALGTCTYVAPVDLVPFDSNCPTGCYYHPEVIGVASVVAKCTAAPSEAFADKPFEEDDFPSPGRPPITAVGTAISKEILATCRNIPVVDSVDEGCITTPSTVDEAECIEETVCAMSQSEVLTEAVFEACEATTSGSASTCATIASGETADCAGALADQATCEAVETAATDDADAKACVWTESIAAPDCTAYAPGVSSGYKTCTAISGCAYTAATAHLVSGTAGACSQLQGTGSCAYRPSAVAMAETICTVQTYANAETGVRGDCTVAAGTGSCDGRYAVGEARTVCTDNAGTCDKVGPGTCTYVPETPAVIAESRDCNNVDYDGVLIEEGLDQFPGARDTMFVKSDCGVPGTPTLSTLYESCNTRGEVAGNCTAIHEMFGKGSFDECKACWEDWQSYTIAQVKGNLWPATICIWSLFLFVIVLICLNNYMIDNCRVEGSFGVDGPMKIFGLVFNGIVFLFGMLTTILGIVAQHSLSTDCPDDKDCTNWACVGVIVLGLFFMMVSVLSVVGMLVGKLPGMMMIRVADVIFVVLALTLMVVGIGFAIVAGAMKDINSQYDENFQTVRAQYEQKDPDLCKGMTDAECREVIKLKTEDSTMELVIAIGTISLFYVFVLFFTLQGYYIYTGKGKGDDDDDSGVMW
jgi:hypothetical protein